MAQPRDSGAEAAAIWRKTLTVGHPPLTILHKVFRYLPGPPRCKICHNPFGGIGGRLCRMVNMAPSRKNPQLCALCCESLPIGGAEVEIAVLFADIRDSTGLAQRLGPTEFAALLNRFYDTATEVLIRHEATIDKLIGDEVMAFFVPGFAGPGYRKAAADAARALMKAFGHGTGPGPWLPVGIGIETGTAFVGNVGSEDYADFTALGDPVNAAAHIQSAAGPGEILLGEHAYAALGTELPPCRSRAIADKSGRALQVRALALD
ncbi:adenylate/guanylate cyclase domain-containing protein [Desertibaculum subflavum]|uniref:adenylate/guanylate cyclase domain-containing protein n=1 Tax=Desertibaculum subflavum TaxID=2268458 RepID=UPI000E672EE8